MSEPGGIFTPVNMGSVSKAVPNFRYMKDQIQHPNVTIGDYSYGTPQIRWLIGRERVTIGKFCSFSPGVQILISGNHPIDTVSSYPFQSLKDLWPGAQGKCPFAKGDVHIGHDVWVGLDAVILSGVTIGHGAVIGTKAVVTKDIPPYAIAVGNPVRIVKYRFDEETIQMLLEVKWWDWPEEKIRRNIAVITGTDIWKLKECE
jgi:acetyltransferase-like isoleucine patch superfamily enzyme